MNNLTAQFQQFQLGRETPATNPETASQNSAPTLGRETLLPPPEPYAGEPVDNLLQVVSVLMDSGTNGRRGRCGDSLPVRPAQHPSPGSSGGINGAPLIRITHVTPPLRHRAPAGYVALQGSPALPLKARD
ncbi:hypothetical protein SKAU_G00093810 [Synaphobranchus kaupii]|uniref:Uncharacterized protein n=1 Tax=Synaphobranchus kaupii TaxID=118154 RepID=A0A9Q1FX20_SYNKA|nr:hypothetical protein SKAU_G00093810 [Synaphobranchus kaupii]